MKNNHDENGDRNGLEPRKLPDVPIIPAAKSAPDGEEASRDNLDSTLVIAPLPASAADESPSDDEVYAALKARRAERRKKKLLRRGIIVGAIVGVLGLGALGVSMFAPKEEEGPGIVTDFAIQGDYITSVSASGKLDPLSSTVISPAIPDGTIAEVRVSAGQAVNKGDVLMVIKADHLDRAVADAERAVKSAQAALANAKEPKNAPETSDEKIESKTVVDQAAVDAAALELESAKAARDAAVAAAAERTVKSPIAGNVVTMNAKVGAPLSASLENGQPLMQIADLSKMKVTIQVGEEDIAKVALDQEATITFPAFEDLVLTGKVSSIASTASGEGMGGMGYDGGSVMFAVDIMIDSPDPRLKPGMTAQVDLTTEKLENVVMVPTIALMTDDGENFYVVVETDPETHEHERRDVTVVAQNDDFAVVGRPADEAPGDTPEGRPDMPASPLSDGESLVISGADLGTEEFDAEMAVK